MLHGLPSHLKTENIRDFYIGDQEASRDKILEECFCEIAPIRTFLKGDKEYLVGAKGSGKSAIFRLLKSKTIEFENKKKLKQIIIAIEQDIDYLAVKGHVTSRIQSSINEEDVKARFVWEVYILFRICNELKSNSITSKRIAQSEIVTSFLKLFDFHSQAASITDVLKGQSKTFGIKLDSNALGMPVPEAFFKVEPTTNATNINSPDPLIDIAGVQAALQKILKESSAYIYVLIDNIDDFLAREEYEAQRLVVQGLMSCVKSYSAVNNIKIKCFIRNEVFGKVKFEKLGGAEKVIPNSVQLKWNEPDLKRFIAERFLHGIIDAWQVSKLTFIFSENVNLSFIKRLLSLLTFPFSRKRDDFDGESETDYEKLWKDVILTFMPDNVQHYNANGQLVDGMELFEYFNSHLSMANNQVTPRVLIIYFNKLINIASEYYENMGSDEVSRNEKGQYPIFLREHLLSAYGELQEEVKIYVKSSVTHPEWKDRITSLVSNIGNKQELSFRELRRMIKYDDRDQDAKELLAFLVHLGVLSVNSDSVNLQDRRYKIPIILQKSYGKKAN